jgi:SAM-dependent methyltransferase
MRQVDSYGPRVAQRYDSDCAALFAPGVVDRTVEVLAELAAGGPALELAIGTGRIGLRLIRRGVPVVGIERSPAMVDQLRAKPGGAAVEVVVGDMTTTRVEGSFRLVYLVFNTITNLLAQEDQVRCFENAAAHLETGGRFVVEDQLPALRRLPAGVTEVVFDRTDDHIGIDEYDVAAQRLVSHHTFIDGDRVHTSTSHHRYAWPAEYDLMARIAGLRLVERWADWRRTPFGADSTGHVSVWQKG